METTPDVSSMNLIKDDLEDDKENALRPEDLSELKAQLKQYDELELNAKCFTVFDATNNKILVSQKGKKQREIASLTKIMTCFIVCQRLK